MKKILAVMATLILSAQLFGQFTDRPGKIQLGYQTTANGLVCLVDSIPSFTPSDENDCYVAQDTVNNKLYIFKPALAIWSELSGGDGVITGASYDAVDEEIDVTVAAPGTSFSFDVSALTKLTEAEVDAFVANNGYLTSYTETDPVYSAAPAAGITSLNITNWNTAYGWGDHSLEGYLTSFAETDPVYAADSAQIKSDILNNTTVAEVSAIVSDTADVLRQDIAANAGLTLQDITDNGNSTTNDIIIGASGTPSYTLDVNGTVGFPALSDGSPHTELVTRNDVTGELGYDLRSKYENLFQETSITPVGTSAYYSGPVTASKFYVSPSGLSSILGLPFVSVKYSGQNILNTMGTVRSSSDWIMGYAVKANENANGIVSSAGNVPWNRVWMQLGGSGFKLYGSGVQDVPIGSTVSAPLRFSVDELGAVRFPSISDGSSHTELVTRNAATGELGYATNNISNWNTAFGWGDHSTAGYLTSEVDGSTTNELQTIDEVLTQGNSLLANRSINVNGNQMQIGGTYAAMLARTFDVTLSSFDLSLNTADIITDTGEILLRHRLSSDVGADQDYMYLKAAGLDLAHRNNISLNSDSLSINAPTLTLDQNTTLQSGGFSLTNEMTGSSFYRINTSDAVVNIQPNYIDQTVDGLSGDTRILQGFGGINISRNTTGDTGYPDFILMNNDTLSLNHTEQININAPVVEVNGVAVGINTVEIDNTTTNVSSNLDDYAELHLAVASTTGTITVTLPTPAVGMVGKKIKIFNFFSITGAALYQLTSGNFWVSGTVLASYTASTDGRIDELTCIPDPENGGYVWAVEQN